MARTNIFPFVLGSEKRTLIVQTLFTYPKRQWSCTAVEELTNLPHATVFRTLRGLRDFGLLKSIKINKRDIIYELVTASFLVKELYRFMQIEKTAAKRIASNFIKEVTSKHIISALLYGSSARGETTPMSDIDLLLIFDKHNLLLERGVYDKAATYSTKVNKTLALTIVDKKEVEKEKDNQFFQSIKASYEVLYGKKPF